MLMSVFAFVIHAAVAYAVSTDCSGNLSTANTTYTLSADTVNTCNVTNTGITINANGHTVGPTPLAFPNNASNSGWLDMTGNKLLYHMDDGVLDSKTGNHYLATGGVTSTTGKMGNALQFNGSDGGINLGHVLPVGSASRTVCSWFNTTSGFGTVFDLGFYDHGPGSHLRMYLYNQKINVDFAWGGLNGVNNYTLGTWNQACVTYDGTNAGLYLNGNLESSGPFSLNSYAGDFFLGTYYDSRSGFNDYFPGSIDEVSIWNRALPDSEILSKYTSQNAGTPLVGNESGLISLFHLNETTNLTTAGDSSGQNKTGTISGNASLVGGVVGSAFSFDGNTSIQPSSQVIPNINYNSNVTISTWMYTDSFANEGGSAALVFLGDKGATAAFILNLYVDNTGHLTFRAMNENCCVTDLQTPSTLSTGTWHHIVGVYANTAMTLYVDGNSVNTGTFSWTTNPSTGLDYIGLYPGGGSYFTGKLDEVAVWNRALSGSEVASIYSHQSGGFSVQGNGNNLTISNMVTHSTIHSAGASIAISNSTVATVDVSGADNTGDGQNGGTVTLTSTAAGALIANGGNSTDYGFGGLGGSFSIDGNSSATSQTANPGRCGPNNHACVNIFYNTTFDGDWDNPSNWSQNAVPDSTTNVEVTQSVTQVSSGNAYANNVTFDSGAVWDPNWWYLTLNVTGTATFSDGSYQNYGQIYGNVIFNGASWANSGYIWGSVVMNGTSYLNNYQVSGDAIFNDSSYFNCGYVQGNATFNNDSYMGNCGSSIAGNATFNTTWYNSTAPSGGVFTISNGNYWGNQVNGQIYGSDNQPITSFVFSNGSYNYGSIYNQNVTFDGGSWNNNYVGQDATFTNGSYNNGTINGNATFYDSSLQYYGTVYGTATFYGDSSDYYPGSLSNDPIRYYNSPTTSSRDFTQSGIPWVITADGVPVDLSGATCNPQTVFNVVNGGSFTYGPHCLSGPPGISIIRPSNSAVVSTWNPLVNWNQGFGGFNYTGCQYAYGTSTDWDAVNADWLPNTPESNTWIGASCSGNGADISAPQTRGNQIFVIRGITNNAQVNTATSSQVSIYYAPPRNLYFFNTALDGLWSNPANWYTNALHTVPAHDIPYSADKVTITGIGAPSVNTDTWVQPALINSGTAGITFTSAASTTVSVPINGRATFNGSVIYTGTLNGTATFNNTATNAGIVTSNAVFNNFSQNTNRVSGNATFNGDLSNNVGTSTIKGVKTRYYTTTTTTIRNFIGWTVVADGAVVDATGSTHDSSTVFRTLRGGSFVGGPTTVYFWTNGTNTSWSYLGNWWSDFGTTTPLGHIASTTEAVVTLGTTSPQANVSAAYWHTPSGIDATRTGILLTASSTAHINTGITGTTTIRGALVNDGTIAGDATFGDTSSNSQTGVVTGNATFNTASVNSGTLGGDAVFNNASYNTNGGNIAGDVTFNGTSYNDTTAGNISGTATFAGSSHNDGTIVNDAVFVGDVPQNNGTVEGTQTRYYSANATTTRDFVTTGPWTLVADGAIVNLANASVFSATSTTFVTMNNGSFTGEGLPGATTCTKPLMFPGTYTLTGNISATCDVRADGVIINGAGHVIGHVPQALPNNASNSGWFDMTSNIYLGHMDETGPIADAVTGAHYTPVGGVTTVAGKLGNAVQVGNSSGYIDCNTASLPYGNSARTMSVWFKTSGGSTDYAGIIDYGTAGYYQESVIYMQGGTVAFDAYGTRIDTSGTGVNPEDGAWHLVTTTYDGAGTEKIYFDGVFLKSASTPTLNTGQTFCRIGQNSSGAQFVGSIDEPAVWNRALSSGEISTMYASQNSGTPLVGNESGLVSLIHLNETLPGTVADVTGANPGVVSGDVSATTGKLGGAAQFDGSSGKIAVNHIDLNNKPFSISVWIKRGGGIGQNQFLATGQLGSGFGTNQILHLGFRSNNTFTFAFLGDDLNTSGTYTDTNWNLWTVTFATTTRDRRIYMNGSLVAEDTASAVYQEGLDLIGARADGYYFNGLLDEFGVWTRTLSPTEVANMYTSQNAGTPLVGNESGLISVYHLNESSFSSGGYLDYSGANNNLHSELSIPSSVPGVVANALHFDGGGILDNENMTPHIDGTTDYSMSAWIKATGNNSAILQVHDSQQNPWGAFWAGIYNNIYNNGDTLEVACATGGAWWYGNYLDVHLPDLTNWHLVTCTYTQSNNTKTLYIDGVQAAQNQDGNRPSSASTERVVIGGGKSWAGTGGDSYYVGAVDEPAIWTRALSANEVSAIYTMQSAGTAIVGNGKSFTINNLTAGGTIVSPGATISVNDSTVGTVNVSGLNAAGDAQSGGAIHTSNVLAAALIANGGNSTDYGFGGNAGTIIVASSSVSSQSAVPGQNGPNLGAGQQRNPNSGVNPIVGCTDPSASNYNPNANTDNGSCRYPIVTIRGCTDPAALNYNPSATINNGSCSYPLYTPPPPPPSNPNQSPTNGNDPAYASVVGSGGIYNVVLPLAKVGKLDLKPLISFGETTGKNSFSFIPFFNNFLFSPVGSSTLKLDRAPELKAYLASLDITYDKDLIPLRKQSKIATTTKDIPGFFKVYASFLPAKAAGGTFTSEQLPVTPYFASSDAVPLAESATVLSNSSITIAVIPTGKGTVTATFDGKKVPVTTVGKTAQVSLTMPGTPGRYLFTTPASPLPLLITVEVPKVAPLPVPSPYKDKGLFGWLMSFF